MPRQKSSRKIKPQITVEKAPVEDIYWHQEIEDLMKLGYSYDIAYALVSKRKIQDFFAKDIRITNGR